MLARSALCYQEQWGCCSSLRFTIVCRWCCWFASEHRYILPSAALLSCRPSFRRCCPALVQTDIMKENSQGRGWTSPHLTLQVRPWKHMITRKLIFSFLKKAVFENTNQNNPEQCQDLEMFIHRRWFRMVNTTWNSGSGGRAGKRGRARHKQSPKVRNTSARMKESTSGTWQLDRVLLSLHGDPQQPVKPVKPSSATHKADPLCSDGFWGMQ